MVSCQISDFTLVSLVRSFYPILLALLIIYRYKTKYKFSHIPFCTPENWEEAPCRCLNFIVPRDAYVFRTSIY